MKYLIILLLLAACDFEQTNPVPVVKEVVVKEIVVQEVEKIEDVEKYHNTNCPADPDSTLYKWEKQLCDFIDRKGK